MPVDRTDCTLFGAGAGVARLPVLSGRLTRRISGAAGMGGRGSCTGAGVAAAGRLRAGSLGRGGRRNSSGASAGWVLPEKRLCQMGVSQLRHRLGLADESLTQARLLRLAQLQSDFADVVAPQ